MLTRLEGRPRQNLLLEVLDDCFPPLADDMALILETIHIFQDLLEVILHSADLLQQVHWLSVLIHEHVHDHSSLHFLVCLQFGDVFNQVALHVLQLLIEIIANALQLTQLHVPLLQLALHVHLYEMGLQLQSQLLQEHYRLVVPLQLPLHAIHFRDYLVCAIRSLYISLNFIQLVECFVALLQCLLLLLFYLWQLSQQCFLYLILLYSYVVQ
jgi:hypothetical protein